MLYRWLIVLCVLSICVSKCSTHLRAQAAQKWNVLLLFADDQRADTIAALGNPVIQTPNLDALARRGVAFRRAYMQGGQNGATCVPSRAMLLSGRSLFHVDEKLMRDPTWPSAFAKAGYTTFMSGKWHNGPASIPKSFQIAQSIFTGGMTNPLEANLSDMVDGKLTRPHRTGHHACEDFSTAAIDFLQQDHAEPFFCYVPYDAPHDPHIVPENFAVKYDPDKMPKLDNYLPHHPWDNGEMTIRDESLLPWPRTKQAVDAMNAEYYRYISYLDAQIGRVLDALKASAHADNTIVVFTSDSGVARGSHGLIGKQNVFEHSIRVPLIIAGPGIPAGQQSDAMCYLFDLLPTIGKLCGVPGPATSEGLDLSRSLLDPTTGARHQLMFAYKDVQRAVRDERWKLIIYPKVDKTFLFDLQADPHETQDLAQRPELQDEIARLRKLLQQEQSVQGDDAALSVRNPQPAAWSPPDVRSK